MQKKTVEFNFLVRNLQAGELLEKFIISAVTSILLIRVFLALTNYPIIGSGNFHIAHMLFGGILMTISLFSMIIFLNNEIKNFVAIIGGIGFGTFIDELGKFITMDNNYFFQPTIAIIYVIFILLYFIYKYFNNPLKISKKEYAVNAVKFIKEIILNDFEKEEKQKAKEFLKKSDSKNNVIKILNDLFSKIETIQPKKKNIFYILKSKIKKSFFKITNSKNFAIFIITFFTAVSVFQFVFSLNKVVTNPSFSRINLFSSSTISGIFVLFGIYFLVKRNKLKSYNMFKISVLISIFLTQFFLFFEEQLIAVIRIMLDLIILVVLQNLINYEKIKKLL